MPRVQYINTFKNIGLEILFSRVGRKSVDDPLDCLKLIRMSFCGWFSGEKFRDHFEKGEVLLIMGFTCYSLSPN